MRSARRLGRLAGVAVADRLLTATGRPAGSAAAGYQDGGSRWWVTPAKGAARGAIGAMAMSGFRQITKPLGLIEATPPEAVLRGMAPGLLRRVPPERRPALLELVHCGYGTAGGIVFGTLPCGLRRRPWAGPVYGLLIWAVFEAVIAPALGPRQPRRGMSGRLTLVTDHVLYGSVVAAAPWLHRD
jgi:hypothetical protein